MRDNKKRIEVMISSETGDYIEMMSFDELEKKYGTIPFHEKLVNKVIKASVSWNLRNGVMFLTVQNGSYNESKYTLDNVHGSWGNLTKYW